MDIQSLKLNLNNVMPILDVNLGAAYREYMSGDLPAGAYHYVRSRHEAALAVLSRDDLEPEAAYRSCALLAIDLRGGLKESAPNTSSPEAQVEAWWQCYREAGFTEVNQFFDAPMLPLPVNSAES
ncbi:hypothetical protein [Pseudomonas sp. NPDC089569]|uniref:hypothetical protein n=1 Tax=Pseudomonas sp. NPDC089569 TaxID=3390722 RepID=UPI003D075F84